MYGCRDRKAKPLKQSTEMDGYERVKTVAGDYLAADGFKEMAQCFDGISFWTVSSACRTHRVCMSFREMGVQNDVSTPRQI